MTRPTPDAGARPAPTVVVVGPVAQDVTVLVEEMPEPGSTVHPQARVAPGGKGANPALAAARLGASVRLVGAVGDDATGEEVLASLRADGVDVDGVQRVPGCPTGRVLAVVDGRRRVTYYECPYANDRLTIDEARLGDLLSGADACLVSTALPAEPVVRAIDAARRRGVPVTVDLAGEPGTARLAVAGADVVRADVAEAATLAGHAVDDPGSAVRAARGLLAAGPRLAVVAAGGDGNVVVSADGAWLVGGLPGEVLDPTGAGDALVAAVVVARARGDDPLSAVRLGSAAAADTVARLGGTPRFSVPDLLARAAEATVVPS